MTFLIQIAHANSLGAATLFSLSNAQSSFFPSPHAARNSIREASLPFLATTQPATAYVSRQRSPQRRTTKYYKVLVLFRTTKYYSRTTPYYRNYFSTSPYYKVLLQYYSVLQSLLQYYSVLQSTTPVLLRTTKYYSSTTKY